MGNSSSSDEVDNPNHNENDAEKSENDKENSNIESQNSFGIKTNNYPFTSEANVRLGTFNQPLKITKIHNRKDSMNEISTICDNGRPSVHNRMHQIEKGIWLLSIN